MELIKRDSDYALWSLSYMATFPREKVFGLSVLGKHRNISTIFLRKIFQKLAKKKIVHPHRGRYGGFSLAEDPSKISVAQVIEAIQGPVVLNKCLTKTYRCPMEKTCVLRRSLAKLQAELSAQLFQLTLQSLVVEKKEMETKQ